MGRGVVRGIGGERERIMVYKVGCGVLGGEGKRKPNLGACIHVHGPANFTLSQPHHLPKGTAYTDWTGLYMEQNGCK
jgi:hypothetical protein